ncbi:cysteine desulfurase family protein [Phragmitibacter flavus]|uniref:cysteine desulfurase family protein n=1 Tax=Phragmitibacter flavus TaxID=2576071 RepID=UPI00140C9D6A|nr:aminotransferase class V-fold PLP-dependent enzyme [Phragmitibacter flavus]
MIYLDHNATTPVLQEVREAMLPYLSDEWGNPSSSYRFGSRMKSRVEEAREQVAGLIGCKMPREIVFTSGGTESNNTAIHAAIMAQPDKRHIITSQVEHSSVLTYCGYLERHHGYRVTYLPVNQEGLLSLVDLESALGDDVALVSLMWANNETGVLFPVAAIAELCRGRGVPFHCDAVQAVGKLPVNVRELPVDYLTLSGHKLGVPQGVGAVYVHKKAPFVPYLHGGHQERARRGGTENVPYIIGLGKGAELARKKLPSYDRTVRVIRDELETRVLNSIPNTEINGHAAPRLANTSNITFHGIESEALLLLLDQADICASSGSACLADSPDPSHVIAAMNPGSAARQCVRFSLGLQTGAQDIAKTLESLKQIADTFGGQLS